MSEIVGIGRALLCRFSLSFLMTLCDISTGHAATAATAAAATSAKSPE